MNKQETAGELSHKANAETTKYDAREVGHALSDDIGIHLRQAIENHKSIIDEEEFCVVMIIAKDPLIHNLMRRKFYCLPYLPSPRPNQAVFLYNKIIDDITKRLWILPSDIVMTEIHSLPIVAKHYVTMKKWSDWFFHGRQLKWTGKTNFNKETMIPEKEYAFVNTTPTYFWEKIRSEHKITMPSEHEYFLANRDKLIEAGCQIPTPGFTESFDFSKISGKKVIDSGIPIAD